MNLKTTGEAGGPNTRAAESMLRDLLDDPAMVALTTSCTSALEMGALLADLEPGDEVAVPDYGFVTTALAFVRAGARVRFIDIDATTLGMNPDHLRSSLTDRTKVVVPIHYAGIPVPIDEIASISARAGAILIEDAAHALTAQLRGKPLGTFGSMAALSFHATKNFSCGEGGALVVNDHRLVDRAHLILEKGTDRRRFLDGAVDKYTWRDIGSSFGMSDFLAERLIEQLALRDEIQRRRKAISDTYDAILGPMGGRLGFRTPAHIEGSTSAYHIYYVVLDDPSRRDPVLHTLREAGIGASFHYVPLHQTPGGQRWGEPAECPVSIRIASSIIRLPLHQSMTVADAESISTSLLAVLGATT